MTASNLHDTIEIGDISITFSTGEIARQASGAVVVQQGDAAVLVTAVSSESSRENINFFPLTVDYRELFGAAGSIPHSYGKREGKLSEHEILTSRIIDRSIRPLFPNGYLNETQIIATLLSADLDIDTDVLALIGAMMALHISNVPWSGPAAGCRIIRTHHGFIVNPPKHQRDSASLDLVISMGSDGLIMMEGHAQEALESEITDALIHCRNALNPFFDCMNQWRSQIGIEKIKFSEIDHDDTFDKQLSNELGNRLEEALYVLKKKERHQNVTRLKKNLINRLADDDEKLLKKYTGSFERLKYETVRNGIIKHKKRLDGRNLDEVRSISGRTGWLKTPHGSAVFTRGETQACVTCTLAPLKDTLRIETVYGDNDYPFFLHYHFPPYSVGEVRPMRGPGRREIGHGYLAWKALLPMLPTSDDFPYAIRVFSEITESNGSSSMASVCGGCLALMDAGVPLKKPVAGVAMGLIMSDDDAYVLTDILGDEDHLGDMDFKVAGTHDGITAIQMDNKVGKISMEIMTQALEKAKTARLHILEVMSDICPMIRSELKPGAPRIQKISIRPEKIGKVIGSGGRTIQELSQSTGATIDIDDNGTIMMYADTDQSVQNAKTKILELTRDPEINHFYHGKVIDVKSFGAFVEFLPGTQGMVHISELAEGFVKDAADVVKLGDIIPVKVLGVDMRGRIGLSRKAALNVSDAVFDN